MSGLDLGDAIDFSARLGHGMTLASTGKMPPGFPRGEFLSEHDDKRIRRYDPLKVLIWVRTVEEAIDKEYGEAAALKRGETSEEIDR
ncbi:MAG: hypothetical protein HQL90_15515 [Magnetococcales bacterium]|nr:hypothetical protein [Magnetococcales bacterium]